MTSVSATKGTFSIKAYRGDAKTLLAFNFGDKRSAANLAGFTIQCQPKGQPSYFIYNSLQFKTPGDHAQDPKEPPNSSVNAPIHKFRWVHVPGSVHQGVDPFMGDYTYSVTPRYFDDGSLQPLDSSLTASVVINVDDFAKGNLQVGFTRGYTQSQAFVGHFGRNAVIRPKGDTLLFDTSQNSGTNAQGQNYTFAEQYAWLGSTVRAELFNLLNDVIKDRTLIIDVFAYDLSEPDLINILLSLAKQGRIRIILDNASLHHSVSKPKPEDQFEKLFTKAAAGKQLIKRGKFGRYAHDKAIIVYKKVANKSNPIKVLTGSTNFSVTGLYVNSNHILIYDDPLVAADYAGVFQTAWDDDVKKADFVQSKWSSGDFPSSSKDTPKTDISFAPHSPEEAEQVLGGIADRINAEGKKAKAIGSVLFAVMQIDVGTSPVYSALKNLHKNQKIFSYGISDSPGGIALFPIGAKTGVLVTGKPINTQLPPPFNQVPNVGGVGHQIHHKFVVCGFNGDDPVVFCGSSNLATGGEENNGDNLLAIHDGDIATVFAIEALLLVDHFNFLDSTAKGPKGKKGAASKPSSSPQQAAVDAAWFLSTDDKWTAKYFDPKDLHSVDRQLFG